MSLLFETIRVLDREAENLEGHNDRAARSRTELLGATDVLDLGAFVHVPEHLVNGLFRCRVFYDWRVERVEFLPYTPRPIGSVRLVNADHIRYRHKFTDRAPLDALRGSAGTDEILMVVSGFITDFSHANIALHDGTKWVTPSTPLLAGTRRRMLLDRGVLVEEEVRVSDLPRFSKAAVLNAMLDLGDLPFIDVASIRS